VEDPKGGQISTAEKGESTRIASTPVRIIKNVVIFDP